MDQVNYVTRASKFSGADNYGTTRGQGGVALFWGKHLGGVATLSSIIHDRICGIRFESSNGAIINNFAVNLPAQGSSESYSACLDDLSEIVEPCELGSQSIICGDTNADLGYAFDSRSNRSPSQQGKMLAEFNHKYALKPVNPMELTSGPVDTYIGPTRCSMINYILMPNDMVEQVIS